jgi:hypothetical protein
MQELNQAGNFRGKITSYALSEMESKAVSVKLVVALEDIYFDGEWSDWREYEIVARGDIWVVTRSGQLNKTQVEALCNFAGWDGSFTAIVQGTWKPLPIGFSVSEDKYKETVRYRISWLNGYDHTPGGGNVDADKAKELEKRFGGELRALSGNATRNQAPPAGKPGKPPGKPSAKKGNSKPESTDPVQVADDEDGCPF